MQRYHKLVVDMQVCTSRQTQDFVRAWAFWTLCAWEKARMGESREASLEKCIRYNKGNTLAEDQTSLKR